MNWQPTATWTAKQERLALLLAGGKGIKAAAQEIGVGERTAHHWLEDDRFRAYASTLRGRLLDEAVGRLSGAAVAAVDVLHGLLADPSGTVRLRAALGIIDALVKVREHAELGDRVARLEETTRHERPAWADRSA
jgi:hypothetical protein